MAGADQEIFLSGIITGQVIAIDLSSEGAFLAASRDSIQYGLMSPGLQFSKNSSPFSPNVGKIEEARFLMGEAGIVVRGNKGCRLFNKDGDEVDVNPPLFKELNSLSSLDKLVAIEYAHPIQKILLSSNDDHNPQIRYRFLPEIYGDGGFTINFSAPLSFMGFSNDGAFIIAGIEGGRVEAWSITERKRVYVNKTKANGARLLPGSQRVLFTAYPGYIK